MLKFSLCSPRALCETIFYFSEQTEQKFAVPGRCIAA